MELEAGFARAEITPNRPMEMAGYDRRRGVSLGTLDPLFVSALALRGGRSPLLLCSFDLLGLDGALCGRLRAEFSVRLRVPGERVLLCATHTHSGPAHIFPGRGDADEDYLALLTERCVSAAEGALEDCSPARLSRSTQLVRGLAAPRNGAAQGEWAMPAETLHFLRERDEILLCGFTCHPTVLDERNLYYSRDLPGAYAAAMGRTDRIAFWNGPCADISTRRTRRESSPAELRRLGRLWATAADAAAKAPAIEQPACIRLQRGAIQLPGRAGLSPGEQAVLEAELRRLLDGCADPALLREYVSRLAVLERGPYSAKPGRAVPVTLVDLGCIVFLCLSLEIGHAAGECLRALAAGALGRPAAVLCYTDGYDGYLPSTRPLDGQSRYEDLASAYSHHAKAELIDGVSAMLTRFKATSEP